jgi:O-antigen/teichoic acid export membrane protein
MTIAVSQSATLKQRILRAGVWSFAGYGMSQAIRLGSNLIMTRLLVPEMFGVMAIAIMLNVMLVLLTDIGLRQNIVQSRRGEDPAFLDTAWVVQIARGFLLWLVALCICIGLHFASIAGAFPANSVYANPILPFVIALTSFATVVTGFQSTRIATAHRNFNQKRLAQAELISQLTGLVTMIAIALVHHSIWSLVAGGLVTSLTLTVLSHVWMTGHANRFRCDKDALRELIAFGRWIFLSSALYVFVGSGDRLLLGGLVDAHVLGMYSIAVLIVTAVQSALSRFSTTVSLPTLSEIARTDRARLREIYYKLRLPGDLLLLFLTGLLAVAGQFIIDALYDSRYADAGWMLQILALSLFSIRYDVAHQIYLALGITRYLTIIQVVRFTALYALVPPLFRLGGTDAAIWVIALNSLASVPLIFAFNAKLGFNDLRRELMVLIALPAGMLCGLALNLIPR